eukprot:3941283-Rhodomonas_salina.5
MTATRPTRDPYLPLSAYAPDKLPPMPSICYRPTRPIPYVSTRLMSYLPTRMLGHLWVSRYRVMLSTRLYRPRCVLCDVRHSPGTPSTAKSGTELGYAATSDEDKALVSEELAAPLKAEGNAAFSAKKFKVRVIVTGRTTFSQASTEHADAAEKYTAALSHNPFEKIFYSNRSACYVELDECHKVLDPRP